MSCADEFKPYTKALLDYLPKASPQEWHQIAYNWTFELSEEPLLWIIRQPQCNKGTALMIYWAMGALWFTEKENRSEVPEFDRLKFDLVREIEDKYTSGFYTHDDIYFDPKSSDDRDWTKPEKRKLNPKWNIPEIMTIATKGKEIAPEYLNAGLPDEVVDAAIAQDKSLEKKYQSMRITPKKNSGVNSPEYFIYQTNILTYGLQYVQAKLLTPTEYKENLFSYGEGKEKVVIRSPLQREPYGGKLNLTFQVNPKHEHPDNYCCSHSFELYSERLINLLKSFGVTFESFPVRMVDKKGNELSDLKYHVFHLLEENQDAMDVKKSGWKEKNLSIAKLVLKQSGFTKRPMFVCSKIHLPLMRNDVKQMLNKEGITGFGFSAPEKYHSIEYGLYSNFDD